MVRYTKGGKSEMLPKYEVALIFQKRFRKIQEERRQQKIQESIKKWN